MSDVDPGYDAPPAEAPSHEPSMVDTALPETQAVFDRGYVQKIRDEAAAWRTKLRETEQGFTPFKTAFDGVRDDDREVFLNLISTYKQDPAQAAELFRQIADGLSPAQQAEVAEQVAEAKADGEALTPERVQQMIAEAIQSDRAQVRQQQQVEQIHSQVRAAGFEPDSLEGMSIMWLAVNKTNGDMGAAISEWRNRDQSVIDQYVQGKSTQPGYLPPSGNAGTGAATLPKIENVADGAKAASAYIRQLRVAEWDR